MATRTKTIAAGIASLAILFVGGVYYDANTLEVVPEGSLPTIQFEAQDNCKIVEITRLRAVEGLSFWREPWFTLNDIQSEIATEFRNNGESDRYLQLTELKNQVELWLSSEEFTNGCENRDSADLILKKSDVQNIKNISIE